MIQTSNFRPKFFTSIRHYNKSLFVSDLMAGAIVGIVALPLAIAFAIALAIALAIVPAQCLTSTCLCPSHYCISASFPAYRMNDA